MIHRTGLGILRRTDRGVDCLRECARIHADYYALGKTAFRFLPLLLGCGFFYALPLGDQVRRNSRKGHGLQCGAFGSGLVVWR